MGSGVQSGPGDVERRPTRVGSPPGSAHAEEVGLAGRSDGEDAVADDRREGVGGRRYPSHPVAHGLTAASGPEDIDGAAAVFGLPRHIYQVTAKHRLTLGDRARPPHRQAEILATVGVHTVLSHDMGDSSAQPNVAVSVRLLHVRGVGSERCCRSWPVVIGAAPRTCRTGRRGLIGAWHRPH
jgi:hypothetical protein